ncbi:uncharacterized protein V1516DRAFT_241985 [Lipomyces oligophaga]|uniref:uncharacterized protein n=1 Tax=Lipomyces oligophaga TaxID=45792 RepID=UPI0034CEC63A
MAENSNDGYPAGPPASSSKVGAGKGKTSENSSGSRSGGSGVAASAAALLSSFTTPNAISGAISSAAESSSQQKGQQRPSAFGSAQVQQEQRFQSGPSSSSSSYPTVSFRMPDSTNGLENQVSAQSDFDSFIATPPVSHPVYSLSDSRTSFAQSHVDPNDGDLVVAFLSSSNTTQEIYSEIPDRQRTVEPTPSQLGYDRLLADVVQVDDPVEYILTSTSYTQDVWGDSWPELQAAKQAMANGNREEARRRAEAILGKIKARL